MSTFSFVILLEYLSTTLEDLKTFGLQIIENESDLELGYITVFGKSENVNELKAFLNGTNFI